MTGIVGCLALLLGFFGTAKAQTSGAACIPLGPVFTVANAADAMKVASGFNCPAVHLVINFSLGGNVPGNGPQVGPAGPGPGIPVTILGITAKTITITSPTPTDPAQRILIINDNAASQVTLTAVDGDIIIDGGTIKAHKILRFRCTEQAPPCTFKADNSDLIAATSFDNPVAGGGLFFDIFGPINIHTTTVHGGDTLEMESVTSSITLICLGGGPSGCKDPNVSPFPQIILDNCTGGTGMPPIQYPCTLPALSAADLTSICFPVGGGVVCNGGHKEKRFTAGTFIDFTGSTITADEHVTFTCKGINFPGVPNSGDLLASGATFDMESLVINCKGKIDLSNSTIVMAAHLTVNSGLNCPNNTVCIDASGAKITAKPIRLNGGGGGRIVNVCGAIFTMGPGAFPNLNGDTTPLTYDPLTVLFAPYQDHGGPVVIGPNNCPAGPPTMFN